MEEGPRHDWLEDKTIFAVAVLAAAGAVLFFWRALRTATPIVDLRAFLDRNFAIGSLYSFILGIGLYGSVYLMPLFLARVRGFNSLEIGTLMIVTGAFQFVSAPLAGVLSKVLDLRLTTDWGFWQFFLPQALRGVSLMLCFIPINTLALGTLPPEKLKNASGLYNLMRNLGGAIGLAAINTVMTEQLALHWSRLVEHTSASRPLVQGWLDATGSHMAGAIAGDPEAAAIRRLGALVMRQALVMSFNDALILMASVFLGALLLMPLVRKPRIVSAEAH
jgi:MFS transporter, DHA2 family, multidrug resistance protein